MGWLKPPEIRGRRVDEMRLFQTGDYRANGDAIKVWRVDKKGHLRGLDRAMHGDELLAMMKARA
jgi:lysozyme